ncbi:MAG: helix-turn-helix transcriptional regulator [Rhodospirillales bacterium]|nr:helix-turn-helix transcriptional regulator [Rhodospirillales bacterium]
MEKTLGSKEHRALIDFLVQQRERLGMTQSGLADAIGEYQSFVARLESGQRRLDVIELLRLAEVLKFDAKALLGDLQKLGN